MNRVAAEYLIHLVELDKAVPKFPVGRKPEEIRDFAMVLDDAVREVGWLEKYFVIKAIRDFMVTPGQYITTPNLIQRARDMRSSLFYAMPNKEKEAFKKFLKEDEQSYLATPEQKQIQG